MVKISAGRGTLMLVQHNDYSLGVQGDAAFCQITCLLLALTTDFIGHA